MRARAKSTRSVEAGPAEPAEAGRVLVPMRRLVWLAVVCCLAGSVSGRAPAVSATAVTAAGEGEAGWRELPGRRVTLLVPPARLAAAGRQEMERLAAELDAAVAAMAPRVPVPLPPGGAGAVAAPIVVKVEDDFVAQARHAGAIGEAVPAGTPGDRAELHLVCHPDDLFAYRVALAERLIVRSGLAVAGAAGGSGARERGAGGPGAGEGGAGGPGAGEGGADGSGAKEGAAAVPVRIWPEPAAAAGVAAAPRSLPPWLERGAALWLAGDWYGKPYRDWLPWLAGSGALPSAAELLAPGAPAGGPAVLWTPVAAALLDRLPGTTLAAKLGAVRRLTPPEVDAWLGTLGSPSTGGAGATSGVATGPDAPGGRPAGTGNPRDMAPTGGLRPLPGFLRGVSLAMENSLEGGYHAPALDRQLDRLAALGVDAVSLMPFAFQRGPAAPHLRMLNGSPESESDVGLIHAVRRARAHGLRTLYKPQIWVGGGSWPGDVAMGDEAGWEDWWRDYRRFVLHHAMLARWAGADLFSVGCELSGTLGRAADWRRLIAAVRQVFPGPLTYSGNWNGDLERAPFWSQLDLIGVDAYFPLASDPAAGRAVLARGAAAVAARLAAASRAWRRPLLLTEVGFPASRAAWIAPHREGGTPSQADQAIAYDALFQALGRPAWLAGTFVWKAFSGEADGGRATGGRHRDQQEADFRFLGRQAEAVIAAYYSRR